MECNARWCPTHLFGFWSSGLHLAAWSATWADHLATTWSVKLPKNYMWNFTCDTFLVLVYISHFSGYN